jgi:class 3 adenylate cyclase
MDGHHGGTEDFVTYNQDAQLQLPNRSFIRPSLNLEASAAGWRTGLAYELPSKGLRASIMYYSSIDVSVGSGPVVAGVIGTRKFFYDVWGDAVNIASRMESTGEAGKIQLASMTRELLADDFEFEERGVIDVRGKGPMRTWFLIGRAVHERAR